ncbi:MAG: hypothetical protein LWX70_14370 [Sphingobacteriia bacterium]|nr:hypothetical protein [Sphingobacteriia bacterium]
MISALSILIYLGSLILLAIPLGYFIANIFQESPSSRFRFLNRAERWVFKIIPMQHQEEMTSLNPTLPSQSISSQRQA